MLTLMPHSKSCYSKHSSISLKCKIEDTEVLTLLTPLFEPQLNSICHFIDIICREHHARSHLEWLDLYNRKLQ